MSTKAVLIIAGAVVMVACSNAPRVAVGTGNLRHKDASARTLSAGTYDDTGQITMAPGTERWRMEASAAPAH
jgi:hypothetical protein